MLPQLLLLATSAEPDENASGVTKLFSDFGIDPPLLLAQILSFSVVAFLLWKFAFKPVLATLEDRQRQIESGLKYAEEMKAKLAQAQQDSVAIIKQAQREGTTLVEEARKTAKEFLDRQQQEATARANDLLAKAQQAVGLEHKKMLEETRGEIARLVVTTTQRVLAKELSEAERARYNEAATREITTK
ncbi:MAG: F0F1 ATP synthase subunit B [Opitutaceae bacterium]|nr:F0F1 ATP synthase subunit B [Opitutaceae bacterium]